MITESESSVFGPVLSISNGDAEVVLAKCFGPRIIGYSLAGGENLLGWHPEASVETPLGVWRPYGGHRLWLAPEHMPMSYAPDNNAVEIMTDGELTVTISGRVDAAGMRKEMTVTLAASGTEVTIHHRLTNHGPPRNMAAWSLTIMAPGGEAVIPNEPHAPYGPETLLPVRTMAMWPYTHLADPRFSFSREEIRLRVDAELKDPQKIGVLNKQGWAGYRLGDLFFRKRFDFTAAAVYPDMNSNTEIYVAGNFAEVEILSPLTTAPTGGSVTHTEKWTITR
ncbi:MAG: hypothetical protein QUS14_04585 [Pyrinomonadaceae bacterium]|nr:hypothetical protein [Pyrinomonadaceae bacterium]